MEQQDNIPGRGALFLTNSGFVAGAATPDSIPPGSVAEIAFVGRSNVGKSSLVNALCNHKIARTSGTPGATQQINFYELGLHLPEDKRLRLADLPGYGYAKASKKNVSGWTNMMVDYLKGRPQLCRVCLLIDGRHSAKPHDMEMMEILTDSAITFQVVFTKMDEVKGAAQQTEKLNQDMALWGVKNTALYPYARFTSAKTGQGIAILRDDLAAFAPN